MQLPLSFQERMKALLTTEYEAFAASYEKPAHRALRVNTLKITRERFLQENLFSLRPIPWSSNGFYTVPSEQPGKSILHEAGAYYIQEPSAQAVAEAAGDLSGYLRVLDLCAAPGGKSTQLAAAMAGKGLLVSNEIHPARAKILSQNMERMGVSNCIVTNEAPAGLSERFKEFFDLVVADAPCSGEGMFRKEPIALEEWSLENVRNCANRQREVLLEAAKMVRPGGRLIYSTCTFAPEENEESIACFLKEHPEFSLTDVPTTGYFEKGNPSWIREELKIPDIIKEQMTKTCRLWPHRLDGEGHFLAVLLKENGAASVDDAPEYAGGKKKKEKKGGKGGRNAGSDPYKKKEAERYLEDFYRENKIQKRNGVPILFGENLYLLPEEIDLQGLKVLRPGLQIAQVKKNRLEAAHALGMALHPGECDLCIELSEEKALKFLRGESLPANEGAESAKGYGIVTYKGVSLGLVKASDGTLKNHYPKGLRINW